MICPKCSRVINDNAAFCGYCGATITKKIEETLTQSDESTSGNKEEISEIKSLNEVSQVEIKQHDNTVTSPENKKDNNDNPTDAQQGNTIGKINATQALDNNQQPINHTIPLNNDNIKGKSNKEKKTVTKTDNQNSKKHNNNKDKENKNIKTANNISNNPSVTESKSKVSKPTTHITENKEPISVNNKTKTTVQVDTTTEQQSQVKKTKMGRGGIIAVSLSVSIVLIASVVIGVLFSKGVFNKEKPNPENPKKVFSNGIGSIVTTEISLDENTEPNTINAEATTQQISVSQTEESTTSVEDTLTTAEEATTAAVQTTVVATTKQAESTRAPATQAPATRAPATRAPATQAPATRVPATRAPATQAPATRTPVTQAPTTQAATAAAARQTSVHSYAGKVDNSKLVVIDDSAAVLTDAEYNELRTQMQQVARSKSWNIMIVFSNSGVNYDTNPNKDTLAYQYYNNTIGSNGGSDIVNDGYIMIIDTISNTYTFNIFGYASYTFANIDPADLGGGINSYVSYDDYYGAAMYLINY